MEQVKPWVEVLPLRKELIGQGGQLADLQMSLFAAVYQTREVPYRDVAYYCEITEATPGLISFMAEIARRLGTTANIKALYHLDQGMGGGKSHALVGLYHMVNSLGAFFATDLGQKVRQEAESRANGPVDLTGARVVILSADNMTPGKPSPEFGPATTLHERFLWALFKGDREKYDHHVAQGPNKAALQRALEEATPVLILLDELMDYVLHLSDEAMLGRMPGEQAFLNALMDAVDDLPRVAFVVVLIKSAFDERGYSESAEHFRDYITQRLERNGITQSVADAQDFSAILRRRIFDRPTEPLPISELAATWRSACAPAWAENVFERLPSDRSLAGFEQRLASTYPFHPDLMALVRQDWSPHTGFQRVRSTVQIFAGTAHHWWKEHGAGRWTPALIGVGDIPLHTAIEPVLSSGLLHGNDKAIQGFRQVAVADVISKDGKQGRAVELDARFADAHGCPRVQPQPVVRMATALFLYSLVPRAQARRGATKAESLASVYVPSTDFALGDADEAFSLLVSEDEGLGALEILHSGGRAPTRYLLTISQTLRMFYRQARAMVQGGDADAYMWERVKELATRGPFDGVVFVEAPQHESAPLSAVFDDVDQSMKNRLAVLDPRRWALFNGRDSGTRSDITALFGLGDQGLRVDYAASCVVACVNTQRRDGARRRALEALAYKGVLRLVDREDELYSEGDEQFRGTQRQLDQDLKAAFQHYAYLIRTSEGVQIEWKRFDDDAQTALSGNQVWDAIARAGRAARADGLSGDYVKALLDVRQRSYTLREVVRKFWQDPSFPMVANESEVRRSIFDTLQGDDPWEIVDAANTPLTISSPEAPAIHSTEYVIRPARRATPDRDAEPFGPASDSPE